ncbi:ArsR/SmtB family transcription factor [Mammaliicoccus lentus]|uniref:Metalloregulator ArsR/SmtB family transcription factor n=1 Tax=Mammaliicoccus lentus TaxID=42858 RepID=A0ABS6GYJ0_MAMLE|nr:metalloregulator ArsR/SmtB family transcription factor [Mammaliicoccus lentus]MBU6114508.1 metalloregulator ArsR/SmtB family transcription factor [Mammaliicoccus lentus]
MSYKEIASLLKVLADPSRLEIIDLLSCGELCACDILEHFEFSQPTLSHHMKSLVGQNLVFTRKDGNKRFYKLNDELLTEINSNIELIHTSNYQCICKDMKKGECNS